VRAVEWLDGKLFPVFGPPPIGPYDIEPEQKTLCPLCNEPLLDHRLEIDEGHTYLHCPDDSAVFETGRH
jgi:hypothetical protein